MSAEVSGSSSSISGNGSHELTRPRAEALRAEILQTRAELGRTVEALAAKANVKARVRETADEAKVRVRESVRDAGRRAGQPVPLIVVAAGVAALVVFVVLRRRSR